MMATSTASPTQHIVNYGRGVRRLVLTQPPHFRTGADIAPAGPTRAELTAVAALQCSGFARLEQTLRAGTTKATVSMPKQQAKKIRQVLEHHAGIA